MIILFFQISDNINSKCFELWKKIIKQSTEPKIDLKLTEKINVSAYDVHFH